MVYLKHQMNWELGTESAEWKWFELAVASWENWMSQGRDNKC